MRWILISCLAMALVSCDEPVSNVRPSAEHGPAPDVDEDPLGARLYALGREHIPRHELGGAVLRGHLRRGEVEDHPVVLIGTHCYSFIAVASEGVADLDLLLIDPHGSAMMHDTDDGNEATLGVQERICPVNPGAYEIRARVFMGEGDYALRMYEYQVF